MRTTAHNALHGLRSQFERRRSPLFNPKICPYFDVVAYAGSGKGDIQSPGDIWNWKLPYEHSRTDAPGYPPFPGLRLFATFLLANRNPNAAEYLVSQRQMEGFWSKPFVGSRHWELMRRSA